jgi:O-antigen ligase
MFDFSDLKNVPMVSSWVVIAVLIVILLLAVKQAKKWLIRLVTFGLIVGVAFSFYASTLSKNPKMKDLDSKIQVVKDAIKDVKDEIKSEK